MAPKTDFPPIRACLFDMDGLLLNTEDLYTLCINIVLARYGKPPLPWSIKAKLQGRPAAEANKIFHDWAGLPISREQYLAEFSALQREHFPTAQPLPGVETLMADLVRTQRWADEGDKTADSGRKRGHKVHVALATSSTTTNFKLKTSHLGPLFAAFVEEHRVLGDDPRIGVGRGKPLPDIYLLALETINNTLPASEKVKPEECLVFEDSVPGVESGRRAGMRVIWCPHPLLKEEYKGREEEVLAGRTGEAGHGVDEHTLGEMGDGWAEYLPSLEKFPYEKYGIVVPPPGVATRSCTEEAQAEQAQDFPVAEEVEVMT